MSLITCCPACGTMFKVVPDQLRISEGWVRCGHCANVFDAPAHMMDRLPPDAQRPAAAPPPPREEPTTAPATVEMAMSAGAAAVGRVPPLMQRAAAAAVPEVPALEDARAPVFRRMDDAPPSVAPVPAVVQAPVPRRSPPPEEAEPEAPGEPPIDDVSFVRQARRRAFWRQPLVRVLLSLVALALLAALALQFAVHERDRIAAMRPDFRPALEQLCAQLGCQIAPPRQIEAVAIDGSSFNKLRSDTYRLSFTLKNGAVMPVAMPALELTLTDTQDQPVLRRVLVPGDLAGAPPVLPSGGDWSGSATIVVSANGSQARIAGYRLLAFYP